MKSLLSLSTIFFLSFMLNFSAMAEEGIDPLEDINRPIYEFNAVVEKTVLRPVTKVYKSQVASELQSGVGNFFGNLNDVTTLTNQIAQFKPIESVETLGRIVVNTVFGLGGLFDVATEVGLTTDDEDFGQTLAVWGVSQGPYVVMPLLGPSTLRDAPGVYVDLNSPANMINKTHGLGALSVNAIHVIDNHVELLPIIELLEKSDDPYTTMRSAYLQKRNFDIHDGDPPVAEDDEF